MKCNSVCWGNRRLPINAGDKKVELTLDSDLSFVPGDKCSGHLKPLLVTAAECKGLRINFRNRTDISYFSSSIKLGRFPTKMLLLQSNFM